MTTIKRSAHVSKTAGRTAREAAGLTQAEAAALIGFSVRAWQAWELGTRRMRAVLLDTFRATVVVRQRAAHKRPLRRAEDRRGRV